MIGLEERPFLYFKFKLMTKKLDNYKPFYHPKYGWQWLEMEQTPEQEILSKSWDSKIKQSSKIKFKDKPLNK